MTDQAEERLGPKCERLLTMRQVPGLAALVPPLFPLAPLSEPTGAGGLPLAERSDLYRQALVQGRPGLADAVREVCGPAPWIVRSSGIEDYDQDVNAGGYDSLVCPTEADLADRIARVALSGLRDQAQRQMALLAAGPQPGVAACFVQPLLDVKVGSTVERGETPYLDDAEMRRLEAVALQAAELFDMAAVDCEWGLETDAGFVSGTSLVPRSGVDMVATHAFGFGFGAAQTAQAATSTALRPPGGERWLWRGGTLRRARPKRIHLLQARPAGVEAAHRDAPQLTAGALSELAGRYESRAAALLLAGAHTRGGFLAAPTLASAWRAYLALDPAQRGAVALVLTDEGAAAEHAGIMFRQQAVTCLRMETRSIPVAASHALFDRDVCYFGDPAMLERAVFETRRLLTLPGDSRYVFALAGPGGAIDLEEAARAVAELSVLPLDADGAARIVRQSLQPAADSWLGDGARVVSTALAARAFEANKEPPSLTGAAASDAFARLYRQVLTEPAVGLEALSACPDLRLPLTWLRLQALAGPDRALSAVAADAADRLRAGEVRAARLGLQAHLSIAEAMARLPIYDREEASGLHEALSGAMRSGATAEDVQALQELDLPTPAFVRMAAAIAADPDLRAAAMAFHLERSRFRGVTFSVDAVEAAQALAAAFERLRDACGRHPELAAVVVVVRGSLIEAYDAALKAILSVLVSEGGPEMFARYLGVMAAWIGFARDGAASAPEVMVLERLERWLEQWSQEPPCDDYTIEDRNWRLEFPKIAADAEARYENPHVLHNLLHQWMLATNPVGAGLAPARLRSLHQFCATFSSRATKILRFESGLFEIEIPMGTHKVSFSFTSEAIAVEWAEPPDCPDDEIARVLAFEAVLDRYRAWKFPTLTFRREKVVGTWTLFIRINAPGDRPWAFEDFLEAVVALRLLFDGAYDFSYVDSAAADGFAASLTRHGWRSLFETLIGYRATFDDSAQYIFLHVAPLSSVIATLAQSALARGLARRCHRRGFDRAMELIEHLALWLDHGLDAQRWGRRYELLRLASLVTAATWPDETLAALAAIDRAHAGHELLAACVLRRSDQRAHARQLARPDGEGPHRFTDLVLRHAPDVLLTPQNAPLFAERLLASSAGGRRAKHYLLGRLTAALDEAVLAGLLAETDTVPWAADPAQEARIQAALAKLGPRLRFDLARGLDWTGLDAWLKEVGSARGSRVAVRAG